MAAKLLIAVIVYGGIWLGMSWLTCRVRWAALPDFPGGRRRLFAAIALLWSPWFVGLVAQTALREVVDPDDRLGLWPTVGLALGCALVSLGLCLLAGYAIPVTRRLYLDLREAGRAARARGA